jgi:hypothetical protein
MLYFKIANDRVTAVLPHSEFHADQGRNHREWESRWDWNTLDAAQRVAESASETTGKHFLAIDRGTGVFPRFDIIEAPQVGDAVSASFNGDSYPEGFVKSISKTMRLIVTTTGRKFYRRNENSGSWVSGSFSLIPGHVDERNAHF